MSETIAKEVVTTETTQTVEPSEPSAITETDDDYKWLTERLDAHTQELSQTRNLIQSQMDAIRELNRTQAEQSQTMIAQLSTMVQTQSETLSALAAASVLSKSTQASLPNTSSETVTETVTAENPENVAEENREQRTEPAPRRRRIL